MGTCNVKSVTENSINMHGGGSAFEPVKAAHVQRE